MDPLTALAFFKKWVLPVAIFVGAVFIVDRAVGRYFDARAEEQKMLQNLIRDTTAQQITIADQERNARLLQESIDAEKQNRATLEAELEQARGYNSKLQRDLRQRNLAKDIESNAAVARDRINLEVNSLYRQFQTLSEKQEPPQ